MKLKKVMFEGCVQYSDSLEEFEVLPIKDGFEIQFHSEYSAPHDNKYQTISLNFAFLKRIAEHFGTDKIDVDEVSESGCETCDWGSNYGHKIQVYNPTKNTDIESTIVPL